MWKELRNYFTFPVSFRILSPSLCPQENMSVYKELQINSWHYKMIWRLAQIYLCNNLPAYLDPLQLRIQPHVLQNALEHLEIGCSCIRLLYWFKRFSLFSTIVKTKLISEHYLNTDPGHSTCAGVHNFLEKSALIMIYYMLSCLVWKPWLHYTLIIAQQKLPFLRQLLGFGMSSDILVHYRNIFLLQISVVWKHISKGLQAAFQVHWEHPGL